LTLILEVADVVNLVFNRGIQHTKEDPIDLSR